MNGVNRITLGNWQAGTGQDGNSISSDPLFIASDDLHIQATGITSPVNNKGTPVAGVADDIDHESRNISAPDIGADEFTPQAGAVIFMSQGWNIVSLPAIPADARKVLLFPTAISKAFAYQGSYLGKDTLVGGTGYWLKFSAAQSVPITGVPHSRDTIDVVAGWNLIGSVDQPIAVLSVLSLTPGLTTSKFFGYAGSYSAADSLYPGRGYWVKANQAGELVLASGGAAAHGAATVRIIPTDEVPPLPPEPSLSTDTPLPERFALGQNYPNPFNPSTVIRYDMPVDGHVTLTVYDVLGQQVASIIDGWQEAGYKSIVISMEGYPSGMYFYRMSAEAFSATKKLLYLK